LLFENTGEWSGSGGGKSINRKERKKGRECTKKYKNKHTKRETPSTSQIIFSNRCFGFSR
jgi:hypothetical protein